MKNHFVTLKGIGSSFDGQRTESLQCSLPLLKAVKISSLPDVLEGAQSTISDMARPINISGAERIQGYMLDAANNAAFPPFLSMTIVLEEWIAVEREEFSNLTSIKYSPDRAYVVNGVQLIAAYEGLTEPESAIIKSSTLYKYDSLPKEVISKVSHLPVFVNVLYRKDLTFSQREIVSLFNLHNTLDYKIHSVSLGVYDNESHPLIVAVNDIAISINLDKLGGMSLSSRISKSDSYVTTQSAMIGLVLAAIGGRSARLTNPIPTKLPDKRLITEELINETKCSIIDFLKQWLSFLEPQFKNNPHGFHYSTQVWQAIGLVIYHLHKTSNTESIGRAASILGSLDYDKSASHWSACHALKLDASRKTYVNATGGGRSLRDGVAEYFISLL